MSVLYQFIYSPARNIDSTAIPGSCPNCNQPTAPKPRSRHAMLASSTERASQSISEQLVVACAGGDEKRVAQGMPVVDERGALRLQYIHTLPYSASTLEPAVEICYTERYYRHKLHSTMLLRVADVLRRGQGSSLDALCLRPDTCRALQTKDVRVLRSCAIHRQRDAQTSKNTRYAGQGGRAKCMSQFMMNPYLGLTRCRAWASPESGARDDCRYGA